MEEEDGQAEAEAELLRVSVGEFVRWARAGDVMPGGQAAVLGHLARVGALSITDLAARESVRHQSMARTVGLLTDQGLVQVETDPLDRRRVLVQITGEGLARLGDERRHRAAGIAAAMQATLDDEERALCRRIPGLLDKLRGHP
ncbi:MarR family winged helix-turn-helix transcriptional regulator [Streptacidiphilus sp. MAP5-3]|uniref:MarR family winged helix-turn-helix transcriptional regulator n=1 Tax=unclassified Streptacidiphilus TaxID=2643834 RepID=UPI00351379DC